MKTTLQALLLILFLVLVAVPALAQDAEPSPDEFIDVEKEATALNMDEIKGKLQYPKKCRMMNIEGKVMVRALIGQDGLIVKHIIRESPHDLMTQEVERVLYSLRFSPAVQNGEPVLLWVTLPFDFKLVGRKKRSK